jgi:DNA modification methylase/ParB-like chromosome segregation protein Spo0J
MIVIREEFKKLIPALTGEEFKQLEANILSEGIRDPLVLWKGYLVDGHNRYAIATEHGLEYKTVNKDFKDSNEVKEWMILNQFGRRNLSNYQRSVLALQLEEVFSVKAKENLKASGENFGKGLQKSAKPIEKVDTRKELAKVANVSHDTIAKVKKIEAVATPEVKAQLSTGELSINQAYQEIKKEENKEQRLIKESIEYKPKNIYIPKIINADCLEVLKSIPDIDLLLTDPPYFTDGDFTNHISQCLQKVKPTGQAYVFAGADPKEMQAYLNLDSHHMDLVQVLVWNYNNTGQRQPNERYTSNFQVCFYFRGKQAPLINKPADGKNQYACQTINAPDGRIGDRYHKWQKPNQLIENLILNSSNVGDFVFDPFAGSGTTLVVAAKNDRVAIGCDIDQEAINLCIKRGCSDEL